MQQKSSCLSSTDWGRLWTDSFILKQINNRTSDQPLDPLMINILPFYWKQNSETSVCSVLNKRVLFYLLNGALTSWWHHVSWMTSPSLQWLVDRWPVCDREFYKLHQRLKPETNENIECFMFISNKLNKFNSSDSDVIEFFINQWWKWNHADLMHCDWWLFDLTIEQTEVWRFWIEFFSPMTDEKSWPSHCGV